MPRFNFNDVGLNTKPNILKINENFNKIKELGITADEIGDRFYTKTDTIVVSGVTSIYEGKYTIQIWRKNKFVFMNVNVQIPKIYGASSDPSIYKSIFSKINETSDRGFKEWFAPDLDYQISETYSYITVDSPTVFAATEEANTIGAYARLNLYAYGSNPRQPDVPYLTLYVYLPPHTEDDGVYNFNIFNFYEGRGD